jgi:hypothetical protein
MRRRRDTQFLIGVFGLVALLGIAAVVAVVVRLERNEVFILALIPTAGLTLAAIIAAVALVFHARRPSGPAVEKHVIHTKERVLDGRQPGRPHIVTVPGPTNALPSGLYPHLLRGAYLAGQHGSEEPAGNGEADVVEGEVIESPWDDEWDGHIRH